MSHKFYSSCKVISILSVFKPQNEWVHSVSCAYENNMNQYPLY